MKSSFTFRELLFLLPRFHENSFHFAVDYMLFTNTHSNHTCTLREQMWNMKRWRGNNVGQLVVIVYGIFWVEMEISRVHQATCWELLMRFSFLILSAKYKKELFINEVDFFVSEIHRTTTDWSERVHPHSHRRADVLPWFPRILWRYQRVSVHAVIGKSILKFQLKRSVNLQLSRFVFSWPTTVAFFFHRKTKLCYANS